MRLDRMLSEMNIGSRSEIRAMAKAGRIRVNGQPVKDASLALSGDEEVTADGRPVVYRAFEYYMLNKPAGVITAVEDRRQKTVMDLLTGPHRRDVAPVGRLDKDTVGLLLLTNDGALAHRLLAPGRHVDKTYFARVSGRLTQADAEAFAAGLRVDEELTAMPAQLTVLSVREPEAVSEALVTVREGKFHQVKRMFAAVGKEVVYLKRLSMGPLTLDPALPEGAWRELTAQETEALRTS